MPLLVGRVLPEHDDGLVPLSLQWVESRHWLKNFALRFGQSRVAVF
jgi:hypothetical protein